MDIKKISENFYIRNLKYYLKKKKNHTHWDQDDHFKLYNFQELNVAVSKVIFNLFERLKDLFNSEKSTHRLKQPLLWLLAEQNPRRDTIL